MLQLSLEVLLKTQNDAVRLNCIGQYISSRCFILRKEYGNAFLHDKCLLVLLFIIMITLGKLSQNFSSFNF